MKSLYATMFLAFNYGLFAQTNPSDLQSKIDKAIEHHFDETRKEQPVHALVSVIKEGEYLPINCEIGVIGHTNIVAYKPLPKQAFDAHLFDQSGKEIPKNPINQKEFGQPLEPDDKLLSGSYVKDSAEMYGHSRKLDFSNGSGESHYWDFNVTKSFQIKKPGEYRLQVQVRLFDKNTNDVFVPFILSPVETMVKISQNDLVLHKSVSPSD